MTAAPVERSEPARPPAAPLRLRHVDSLRAIAALAVVWIHFAEMLLPVSNAGSSQLGVFLGLPRYLTLGRVGVMIFFAISGFVICRSFNGPRAGGARRFLIRRFCRLYPAFWASMIGGVLFWWSSGLRFTPSLLVANATMIPATFGQPDLLGVYWTLEIELLFYALCLGLYLLNGLGSYKVLGGLSLAAAFLPRGVHKVALLLVHRHVSFSDMGVTWMISLAVMFWGAVFRLVYDETGGFRRRPFDHPGTWFLIGLTPAVADLFDPDLKRMLLHGQMATLFHEGGFLLSMLLFALWVAVLRIEFRPLTFLGVISYSLYLFHPVVMHFFAVGSRAAQAAGWTAPWPLWAAMATCGALTVGLCALTYRWVEQPAIALGKRWVRAGEPATADSRGAGQSGAGDAISL